MSEAKTGWWSVKFDLTLDGEDVRWGDLSMDTQAHILEQINEGYYQGEIVEWGEKGLQVKIILTKHQAALTIQALEWAINPDFSDSDEFNQAYYRIINKLKKGLEK